MTLNRVDIRKLWDNAKDSMFHALDHFSKLNSKLEGSRWHHHKWIIISVHHAADKFLKMLLKDLDPYDSQGHFADSQGRRLYLMDTRNALLKYKDSGKLRLSETKLLDLIGSLNRQRNDIEHRNPSGELDVSVAAWSMLAILRVASRRFDVAANEIFDQDPPIQHDIVEAIHWRHLDDYSAFIEAVLREEHPNSGFFHLCPYCETRAIHGHRCEACFKEVAAETCTSCGADFFVPSDREVFPETAFNCPYCGGKVGS